MRRILVPTDFSREADLAFSVAGELAEKVGADIHLIHISDIPAVSDPMGTNLNAYFTTDLIAQLEKNITSKFENYSVKEKNILHTKILWGNISFNILKYIEDENVDLVIMGTKGATGMKELIIGSNTEKIIRKSKCPVLSLKDGFKLEDIKNIIVGISPFEKQNGEFIQKLKELQGVLDAKLAIVYVNTPNHFHKSIVVHEKIKDIIEEYQLNNYSIHQVNDSYEEDGLKFIADSIGSCIYALGTHGRRGLSHLIFGSIAEDINNHVERPIWTYKLS